MTFYYDYLLSMPILQINDVVMKTLLRLHVLEDTINSLYLYLPLWASNIPYNTPLCITDTAVFLAIRIEITVRPPD